RDAVRAEVFPGQSTGTAFDFQFLRGLSENQLESQAVPQPSAPAAQAGSPAPNNTSVIFQAAVSQGLQFAVIGSANLSDLESLSISGEARARITVAVAAGQLVIVPGDEVTLNGAKTIAWYEINPTTGET